MITLEDDQPDPSNDVIIVHPEIRYTLEIRGARVTECMKCEPAEGVRVWRGMLEMTGRRQPKPCQIVTLVDSSLATWEHLFGLELEGEKVLAATPNLFERIKALQFEEIAEDEAGNPPDDVSAELEQLKKDEVRIDHLTTAELIRLSRKRAEDCLDQKGGILTGDSLRAHLIDSIQAAEATAKFKRHIIRDSEDEADEPPAEGPLGTPAPEVLEQAAASRVNELPVSEPELTCTVCGNPMSECIGAEDCLEARAAEDAEASRDTMSARPEELEDAEAHKQLPGEDLTTAELICLSGQGANDWRDDDGEPMTDQELREHLIEGILEVGFATDAPTELMDRFNQSWALGAADQSEEEDRTDSSGGQ